MCSILRAPYSIALAQCYEIDLGLGLGCGLEPCELRIKKGLNVNHCPEATIVYEVHSRVMTTKCAEM